MGATKKAAMEIAEKQTAASNMEEAVERLERVGFERASVYEILHEIDVTNNLIQKQGLDYLPWPVVYETLNQNFGPDWDIEEIDNADGRNYFDDGKTAWVKIKMRIKNVTRTCSLPVMDNRNRSIPVDQLTSFDVNDALQRCKVKAAAYHGLGTDVFCKLDKIEIQTRGQVEAQRQTDYQKRLAEAINRLQMCNSSDDLIRVSNDYRDLWNDAAFKSEGAITKSRIQAA